MDVSRELTGRQGQSSPAFGLQWGLVGSGGYPCLLTGFHCWSMWRGHPSTPTNWCCCPPQTSQTPNGPRQRRTPLSPARGWPGGPASWRWRAASAAPAGRGRRGPGGSPPPGGGGCPRRPGGESWGLRGCEAAAQQNEFNMKIINNVCCEARKLSLFRLQRNRRNASLKPQK